jgi:UDPglucose 6-dehydrogenase
VKFSVRIVGCGPVGLVTGACLAHIVHWVTCLDKNGERLATLKGASTRLRACLEELVSRGARAGALSFVDPEGLPGVVREADVIFMAVETPQVWDGCVDLSSVGAVTRDLGQALGEASLEAHQDRP